MGKGKKIKGESEKGVSNNNNWGEKRRRVAMRGHMEREGEAWSLL